MNDEPTPEPLEPSDSSSPPVAATDDAEAAGPVTAPASLDPPARSGPDTEPQSQFGPPSAGGMIRAARRAQGVDLASLAAMLKIPLRRMEALESGRHEELQGPTFERALAQAACRVLKIDPKPVLALLPQHERNTLERVTEGINTPFRDGQGSGGFELPSLLRPGVIIVVLLIAAAVALFVVPDGWLTRVTHPIASILPGSGPDAPASSATAASAASPGTSAAVVELPVASAAAAAPAAASAPASGAAVVPLPPAVVSATAAQGIDEVLAHVAAAPSIPLQVIATADSWVEVVDAQGHTLLSRVVVAGESVGLDGPLPMHVKIGNAGGTHLKLRGDNVDLTPWTHDNVARLEVK
jgi:cytoskeleton protein RodZ